MNLYSLNGQYPEKLPERIRLSSGYTRTDSNTFTSEEIEDAGYVGPIIEPSYDPAMEQLAWDGQQFSVILIPSILATAENAVSRYFSPYQIAALQRLEMTLIQNNKILGPKMNACKTWLESIMTAWALDPTPKPLENFGEPSTTFDQASKEAVVYLQS